MLPRITASCWTRFACLSQIMYLTISFLIAIKYFHGIYGAGSANQLLAGKDSIFKYMEEIRYLKAQQITLENLIAKLKAELVELSFENHLR